MYFFLFFLLCFVVSGLVMTIRAAFTAPEGFEDEAGFHFRTPGAPVSSAREEVVSLGAREALICR